jgi:hypothetical protein
MSSTEPAAARASTKENPRLPYATGSAGLALTVRGSSRRIMIMRFRPANIRLINRRLSLPRLLLVLCSRKDKNSCNNNHTEFAPLTGSLHIRPSHSLTRLGTNCRLNHHRSTRFSFIWVDRTDPCVTRKFRPPGPSSTLESSMMPVTWSACGSVATCPFPGSRPSELGRIQSVPWTVHR